MSNQASTSDIASYLTEVKRLLCAGKYRFLFFIEKTRIVFDQATSLLVGVSGKAGFLRMISDFVRKKS